MNLKWRLSHVRGYLALGMFRQAEAELKGLRPEQADLTEALELRLALLHGKQSWRTLRGVAKKLVHRQPDRVDWWVSFAYATRRAVSVSAARKILLEAVKLHAREAILHFNLGCYACLLGDLKEARERVDAAIKIDSAFKEARARDPDLESLRAADAQAREGD